MAIFADMAYLIVLCLLIIIPLYFYRQSHYRIIRAACVVYIILTILFIADVFGFPSLISRYAALGLIPTGIIICIATFIIEKDKKFRAISIISAILPFLLLFLLTTICSALLGFGTCIDPA